MSTICKRCVMSDQSDSTIRFDENGICDYCTEALNRMQSTYYPNAEGQRKLEQMISMLKEEGKGKKYDCIMGISGGLDSSYLAYLGYKWGLRILAVHIDDGYDTEISKNNIKKLVEACNIELRTIYPDEIQYNALILAYIKAGVPNLAVPQDNVLVAFLYETMRREKIKYFLSGGNFALESILQRMQSSSNLDVVNIKDINKKFGKEKIDRLKLISSIDQLVYRKLNIGVEIRPLNYIDYNRDRAFAELKEFCGFEYYGRKHLENALTAFIQLYWLPKKFGLDKRSSHLSSMIVSGQMTREEALQELDEPLFDDKKMEGYIKLICQKMGITREELEHYVEAEYHQHDEYKTMKSSIWFKALRFIVRIKHRFN